MALKCTAPQPWAQPLSVVYGGGGAFGVAYGMAVASVLSEAGVPIKEAPALGTSAGSWVAASTVLGIPYETLRDLPQTRIPTMAPGYLRSIAGALFGEATHPLVTASVARLPYLTRHTLDGAKYPLADLVAASSALPGMFAPHVVGGWAYVDGGVRSLASPDLGTGAADLLVVAPVAGPVFGTYGRVMEMRLRREMRAWERRTGGRSHLIRPNAEVASFVRSPWWLFDHARADASFLPAQDQVRALLDPRPELAALGSGLLPDGPPLAPGAAGLRTA